MDLFCSVGQPSQPLDPANFYADGQLFNVRIGFYFVSLCAVCSRACLSERGLTPAVGSTEAEFTWTARASYSCTLFHLKCSNFHFCSLYAILLLCLPGLERFGRCGSQCAFLICRLVRLLGLVNGALLMALFIRRVSPSLAESLLRPMEL